MGKTLTIFERKQIATEALTKANAELVALQKECGHPKEMVQKTPKSNTGNYDPSADSYWMDCHCFACGKSWIEDQ